MKRRRIHMRTTTTSTIDTAIEGNSSGVREGKAGTDEGLSTSTTARCTILPSNAGTPSGRCRPSAFGMYARRTGFARYAPRFSLSERSLRFHSRSSP